MGYAIQEPVSKSHWRTSSSSEKSASGKIFGLTENSCPENRCEALKTRQENSSTATKNALGVHYYKYRHYKADYGRWLGRDPIEENGGINLYSFVENDPYNWWDFLGAEPSLSNPVEMQGQYGPKTRRVQLNLSLEKESIVHMKIQWDVTDCETNRTSSGGIDVVIPASYFRISVSFSRGIGQYGGMATNRRSLLDAMLQNISEEPITGEGSTEQRQRFQEALTENERKACTKGMIKFNIVAYENMDIEWETANMRTGYTEVWDPNSGSHGVPNRLRFPTFAGGNQRQQRFLTPQDFNNLENTEEIFRDSKKFEWDKCDENN